MHGNDLDDSEYAIIKTSLTLCILTPFHNMNTLNMPSTWSEVTAYKHVLSYQYDDITSGVISYVFIHACMYCVNILL